MQDRADGAPASRVENDPSSQPSESATGWFIDPYRLHELRWFSCGTPTHLVRDGGATSHDDPPAEPVDGPLVPPDEVPVQYETVRAGEEGDPKLGPVMIVYNSSM